MDMTQDTAKANDTAPRGAHSQKGRHTGTMRTSPINHPTNDRFIVIRAWQIEACDGDQCGAALLSFFESWHMSKLEQRDQSQAYNRTAEMHGEAPAQYEGLMQWHKEEDLERGVMIYKRSAIAAALKMLVKKGFISVHRNPNERFKFDRTRHFLFHPEAVNEWLKQRELEPVSRSVENNDSTPENNAQCFENNAQSVDFKAAINSYTNSYTNERERGAREKIEIKADEMRDAVLDAIGAKMRFETGNFSPLERASLKTFLAYLEKSQRTPADIAEYSRRLPLYFNKSNPRLPLLETMIKIFDSVLSMDLTPQPQTTTQNTYVPPPNIGAALRTFASWGD